MKSLYLSILISLVLMSSGLTYGQCPSGDTATVGTSTYQPLPTPLPELDTTGFYKNKTGDKRIIYWVHGLSGSELSWKPVGPSTENQTSGNITGYPARKIKSRFPEYSEQDMNSGINDLQSAMEVDNNSYSNSYSDKEDNFIIAHSQGGLVSRGVDRGEDLDPIWQREFGGLVTFGSAHQGAMILNNGLPEYVGNIYYGGNNMISEISTEACVNLSKGPIREALNFQSPLLNKLITWFNIDDSIVDLAATGCEFFGGKILPFALSDFTPPITKEYMVGAPYVDTINNFTNGKPKLAFYGVEQEPVFWRTMNTLSVGASNYPVFGADDDSTALDYKQLRADYYNKYMAYKNQADGFKVFADACDNWFFRIANPTFCAFMPDVWQNSNDMKNAYKEGLDWIDEANEKWKAIIGARYTTSWTTNEICKCKDQCNGGATVTYYTTNTVECMEQELEDPCMMSCHSLTQYHTLTQEKESDGVILVESASNLPGAFTFGDDRLELKKTNHFQLRNSSQTKEKLYKLFKGDYGLYFLTQER